MFGFILIREAEKTFT